MFDDQKRQSLETWRTKLKQPTAEQDIEQRYDELLTAADDMEQSGLISNAEWRQLVREAGAVFQKQLEP
jgi:hypothetical protein